MKNASHATRHADHSSVLLSGAPARTIAAGRLTGEGASQSLVVRTRGGLQELSVKPQRFPSCKLLGSGEKGRTLPCGLAQSARRGRRGPAPTLSRSA